MIIDKQIANLEKQLSELKAEKARLETITPARQLANELHKRQCHLNHIDQCGWEYDKWGEGAKKRWEDKAEKILSTLNEVGIDFHANKDKVNKVVDAFV